MATKKKWSAEVTATSDAMDVEAGTFKLRSAKKIAEAVEHDAEASRRKKNSSYASAMSALTFYMNRAGSNLTAAQRETLERAKEILRAEYGPDGSKATGRAKKAPARKASGTKKKARARTAGATKKKATHEKTTRKKATRGKATRESAR